MTAENLVFIKWTLYKPISSLAIRSGIPRHLTKTKTIAIIADVEFKASNEMCMSVYVRLFKEGENFILTTKVEIEHADV